MGAPTSRSSRCAPPHAPPTRTSSCCACRMAIRRCWGSGVRGCRGANASASPLRGRCCAIRRCSSSTKRRAPSIPSRSGWCRRRSNASWRTGPCSSSPTAWPRCSTPTSSWCWPRDASWSAAATTTCSPPTASIGASTTCNSGPDMLSGFTIVRNAVKIDFPIVPAIRSVLAVCDEVVVNVGKSEDDTRDLVASIGDPRVRILDTEWDFTKKNIMLSIETQRAMDACRGSWGIYIQADEVLHEAGAQILKESIAEWDKDERVEGLLVKYLHFYGAFDRIATSRRWYRREVRCIRLGKDIHPYQGAQGFRVGSGPARRKIRARLTAAQMFHYGWARPARAINAKLQITQHMYPWAADRLEQVRRRERLEWIPLLRPFTGSHPVVAREWIAACQRQPSIEVEPPRFTPTHLRYYVSDWIERLTGARVFEFRNYHVV